MMFGSLSRPVAAMISLAACFGTASAENVMTAYFPSHDGIIGRLSWEKAEAKPKWRGAVLAAALFHDEETGVRGRAVLLCAKEPGMRYVLLPRHLLSQRDQTAGETVRLRIAAPHLRWWAEAELQVSDLFPVSSNNAFGLRRDLVLYKTELPGAPCLLSAHGGDNVSPPLPMKAAFAGRTANKPIHAEQWIYRAERGNPLDRRLWKMDIDASPGLSGTPILIEEDGALSVFGILVAMHKTPSCASFDEVSCFAHVVALEAADFEKAAPLTFTVHDGEEAKAEYGRKKGRNL
ncbi:MAG: hypothetical protein V2I43_22245 [Parvularcula sp.]|jgi:hypothetical protein|nr:hypothetical protein [Parvularcula sp.]